MSKPLSPGHASRVVTIRLTGPQLARLRELGGAAWVRQQIDGGPRVLALEGAIEAMRTAGGRDEFQAAFDRAKGLLPAPRNEAVTRYWLECYADGVCTLCGNHGVIDTRGVTTPAGVPAGRVNYCICPNGQAMRAGLLAPGTPITPGLLP